MKLFVFGLGFSATAAVNLIGPKCDWVAATTRSPEKAAHMKEKGLRAHVFDGAASNELLSDLREATHLIISIAPPRLEDGKDPVLEVLEDELLSRNTLQWVGYYSTVGVYGNHDGDWIDEKAECRPVSARSKARVAAEESWQAFVERKDIPLAILRLAGIYGPGRNTFVNFKEGRARRIIKPGQVFNRIHVADIALMSEALAMQKASGIFNGADGAPAPPQDVVEYAAHKMDVAVPEDIPFDESDLSPMGRSFYGENKRIKNDKIRNLLGRDLRFPNYHIALDELWDSDTWDERDELNALC